MNHQLHWADFDPDMEYDSNEKYALKTSFSNVIDTSILELLLACHVNEHVTATELKQRQPKLYAISKFADGSRHVYVRATSPVKYPAKSLKGYLSDSFSRVEKPLLVFDETFDFVIRGTEIIIFNPLAFERITNSPESAAAASQNLVRGLKELLPIDMVGLEVLEAFLGKNSHARRKAISLLNKPHARNLQLEKIQSVLAKHNLEHDDYLVENGIKFTSSNARNLLSLLNDDVFTGDFSGIDYTAARKTSF